MEIRILDLDEIKYKPATMDLYLQNTGEGKTVALMGIDRDNKHWTIAVMDHDGLYVMNGIDESPGWPIEDGAIAVRLPG